MYFNMCSLARNISAFLWINGRYDFVVAAFTFLDGTLVPTDVLDLRDSKDRNEDAFMTYYDNMLWRDRAHSALLRFNMREGHPW